MLNKTKVSNVCYGFDKLNGKCMWKKNKNKIWKKFLLFRNFDKKEKYGKKTMNKANPTQFWSIFPYFNFLQLNFNQIENLQNRSMYSLIEYQLHWTVENAKLNTHLCPHAVEFVELDCVLVPINRLFNWSVDVYVGAI